MDKLDQYRNKREFDKTPEPRGNKIKTDAPSIFVIQKHQATSLHYDFRIEIDGVLASWAVPKGPSLDPKERRLAMETEDHPIEYAEFEGVIPKGLYGGGQVIIWDRGTYRNLKDMSMEEAKRKGTIEVFLEGEKLRGGFALVKTATGNWLMIKTKDEFKQVGLDIEKSQPGSVVSNRKVEEVGL